MSLSDQFRGYRHPFMFGVHYFGGIGDNPKTLAELAMCQLSAQLRRLPNWWTRFQDHITREQWFEEACQRVWNVRTASGFTEVTLSPKQVNYVLDELSGYAALRDSSGYQVSCFERIWESLQLLEPASTEQLNGSIFRLRKEMSRRSGDGVGVVTALVDPHLYCLVYGKTFISHPKTEPPRVGYAPSGGDVYTISRKHAFLPSDVFISPSGSSKFTSYINNLHPSRSAVYEDLEALLTGFVPLFERSLTDLHRNNPLVQRIPGPSKYTVWDEPDEPEFSDDDEGWVNYERELRHWLMHRPIHLPDVPNTGYPGGLEHRKYHVSLRDRTVQVIVSISETRLRPGGPSFPGTEWHVEGMRNERIVASGIYFSSMDNITETAIQFRMAVTYPRGFSAGDAGATRRTWGLDDADPCHQYVGSRPIQAGLGVVFPNIYQHCQTPFQLVDPSREGHLTAVSFFLVDPDIKPAVSTSMVAPQQKEWVRHVLYDAMDPRLPVEVVDQIVDMIPGLMDDEEAERHKRELLTVRERFREANNNFHFCIPFDIWSTPDFPH